MGFPPQEFEQARELLKLRKLKQQQQLAKQKQQQQEDEDSPESLSWVGLDTASNNAILRNAAGELRSGGELITNGRIISGSRVLNLAAGGFEATNQMPAAYPQRRRRRRSPDQFPLTEARYLFEIIREGDPVACSCDPSISAVFVRRQKALGDVAILFSTISRKEGPHPPELCPCENRWVPTSNGCIQTCSNAGEFPTQQACEAFRANPPSSSPSYIHHAIYNYTGGVADRVYTGGMPFGHPYYFGYYNLFIVRVRNDPARLVNEYIEPIAKWRIDGDQLLDWWEVELILVGGHDRYFVSGGILSHTSTNNWNSQYPLFYTYPWIRGWDGATPPPTGRLFQAEFFAASRNPVTGFWPKRPRYNPSDPDGSVENEGTLLPAFSMHGRVNSWFTQTIPGQPISFPPPSNIGSPDSPLTPTYHYTTKIEVGGLTPTPLEVGEYLISNFYAGEYETDSGRRSLAYLPFSEVSPYICTVGENEFEGVVKYGQYRERIPGRQWWEEQFKYLWCKIDKFTIKNGELTKTTYKTGDTIPFHPNNWMAPLMRNWAWKDNVSRKQEYTCSILGELLFDQGFVVNPDFKNRIYVEYLNGFMDLWINNIRPPLLIPGSELNRTSDLKIQGANIGYDAVNPFGTAQVGVSFYEEEDKIFGLDVGLNQWISSENAILLDVLKEKDVEGIAKFGEVEVLNLLTENDLSSSRLLTDSYSTNLKLNNVVGVPIKIYGLKKPNAVIIEAQCGVGLSKARQNTGPPYFNIYETFFSNRAGEDSFDFLGIKSWAEKFPIPYPSGDPSWELAIPRYRRLGQGLSIGYTLKDCAGQTTFSGGQLMSSFSSDVGSENYWQFIIRPRIIGRC